MIHYRILPEYRLIVVCVWGKVSVEELKKFKDKIRTVRDFPQEYDAIVEVSDLERWYTSEQMQAMCMPTPDKFFLGEKLAIVASTDLAFGMNRMYEQTVPLERSFEICVFRDTASALTWLGREDLDIDRVLAEMKTEES